MRGQAMSPPLTVTLLAALWVTLGQFSHPGPQCDNGKLHLEQDLCPEAVGCSSAGSAWAESTQSLLSIDSVPEPEPARQICMDQPISYTQSLPSSGAYRPVMAESGEYLYCPPQRWLNNLHHGATVLLYHPCTALRERRLLSALARSCLRDFVLTPHPHLRKHTPIALLAWGHTLELSTVTAPGVCDWLVTRRSTVNQFEGVTPGAKYNLLLTWSAELRQQQKPNKTGSLRECCERTLLNVTTGAEQEASRQGEDERRPRWRRAPPGERDQSVQTNDKEVNTTSYSDVLVNETNRTTPPRTGGAQNDSSVLGPPAGSPSAERTSDRPQVRPKTPSGSILPGTTAAPLGFGPSHSKGSDPMLQTEAQQPGELRETQKDPSAGNRVHNQTVRPKNEATPGEKDSRKHGVGPNVSRNKGFDKHRTAVQGMKNNGAVDVRERELEQKKTHRLSSSEPQPGSQSLQGRQPSGPAGPGEGPPPQRTPRTDEAVWAAGALGFLLVLLTLSVLHTRLYRHWRTAPSLYWRDPQQDYDSVADVIRRRLRITKRRKKRYRRQECVLLPSSSDSDATI